MPVTVSSAHCAVQRLTELAGKIHAQLVFGLVPMQPDFDIYRPHTVFLPSSLGAFPWTLSSLESSLSVHTDHVVAYINSMVLEAYNICMSKEVTAAVTSLRAGEVAQVGSSSEVAAGTAAMLQRTRLHTKACMRSMLLRSADTFAAAVQPYALLPPERTNLASLPVLVCGLLCKLHTACGQSCNRHAQHGCFAMHGTHLLNCHPLQAVWAARGMAAAATLTRSLAANHWLSPACQAGPAVCQPCCGVQPQPGSS